MKEFASGRWLVGEGQEQESVRRWTEFLQWTKAVAPGLIEAHPPRDIEDPRSFISLSEWTDASSRQAWKEQDAFRPHLDAAATCPTSSAPPTTSSPPR